MLIRHNMAALNATRNQGKNKSKLNESLEKLSSGYKITRAAHDAAGLAISEGMRWQIQGLEAATQNAEMGVDLAQTAEGGLQEIHAILQRMRKLAVQSANGTYSDTASRMGLQKEYEEVMQEITRIADTTNYSGTHMLNAETLTNVEPVYDFVTVTVQEPIYETKVISTSQAIINKIQATVTNPPVDASGEFKFFAKNGNGDAAQLLYGHGITSWPSIRINGAAYTLRDHVTQKTEKTADADEWSTVYGITAGDLDVSVTQKVSIVDNLESIGGQSYKIDYEVTNNNSSVPVTFDLQYHADTMLGNNDHAPFVVAGDPIAQNTTYPRDGDIPGSIQIFDSYANPFIYGRITVNNSGNMPFEPGSEPDRVNLAQYLRAHTFDTVPEGSIGDSGYSVLWLGRTVAGNSSSGPMTTYYGVSDPPQEIIQSWGETVEVEVISGYRDIEESIEVVVGWRDKQPSLWVQTGANQREGLYIKLCDARASALEIDGTVIDPLERANEALAVLDQAINTISRYRADFGTSQNRLGSAIRYNNITRENVQQAESAIRDVDVADEVIELTKNNILSQAAQAIQAHANQMPEGVLGLLGSR